MDLREDAEGHRHRREGEFLLPRQPPHELKFLELKRKGKTVRVGGRKSGSAAAKIVVRYTKAAERVAPARPMRARGSDGIQVSDRPKPSQFPVGFAARSSSTRRTTDNRAAALNGFGRNARWLEVADGVRFSRE